MRRDAGYESGSGTDTLTFALRVSTNDAGAGPAKAVANGLVLNGATVRAADGTDAALAFGSAPGVVGEPEIAQPGGDGRWGPGETLEVTLAFAEPVVVTGAPTIAVMFVGNFVDAGSGRAAYARGSGTDRLVFAYRLDGAGSSDIAAATPDGAALDGGSIRSTGGLDAVLTYPGVWLQGAPEAPPSLTAADASVQEGGMLAFRVTLERGVAWPVTVRYATADGTATAGADYEAASGTLTFAAGETEKTVSVAALADGVQESAETLTLTLTEPSGATLARATATGTVEDAAAGNAAPFTAQFLGVPPEHDGESVFTFELRFSEEPPELSFATVRDRLLAVTGGKIKRAKRIRRGSNRAFRIHVEPAGLGDVTVAFRPAPECGVPGAVCTADGRALAGVATATIPGPAALSVADAEAQEGAGATLEFAVTLSRARHEATMVDYATSDGTAVAGEDYTATSGTLTFAAGETEKTVSVPILDDAHDDDGETLMLTLSNPRPPETVRLADAVATGTIRNQDPAQKAWLARFGRTVADQVVDAVQARIDAGADAQAHVTLAGERIGLDGDANAGALAEWEAKARLAANGDRFGDEWDRENRKRDRAVAGRELLTGSAFLLRLNAADDGTAPGANAPAWTLWGRGALTSFEGREGDLTLDGEVASGMIGVDRASGMLTLGLMLSHSMGDGSYRQGSGDGASSGDIESTLTGLYPYGRYEASKRLSLWGVAGYGEGELTLTPKTADGEDGVRRKADIDLVMGAVGARAVVLEPGSDGGLELAVKPDAMAVRTTSEDAPGLSAAEADVTRLRLGLEGTWRGVGGLVPSVELALRHDGGDAETGLGVEVGGGLAFSDPSSGLKAEVRGRALIAHADDDYREWGVGGSLALDPGPDGRGLSFALRPAWGQDGSAAERVLGGEPLTGLAANDNGNAQGRLDAEIGYGLPAFGGLFTGTPHAGFSLGESAREYRLGWRLGLAGAGAGTLELGLEATRREPANDDGEIDHTVGFKVRANW